MKLISKPLFGLFAVVGGTAAILCFSHLTSWGKEASPTFTVSTTPINRDARLGTSYAPIVKKVAPSVVNIYSTRFIKERLMRNPMFNDPFFRQFFGNQMPPDGNDQERTRKEQSLGSGVIISPDGYILTANHVVADADEIKVAIPGNKTEYTAKVIGKDEPTDVAVLKIEADNLPAVTLGDSDQLEVGDVVLALGNPFGVGPDRDQGHRQRAGPQRIGFQPLRKFHPDRCRHQSRQLRRRAGGRGRPAGRHQHRHHQPQRRQPGHRFCRAHQHGAQCPGTPHQRRQSHARLSRHLPAGH